MADLEVLIHGERAGTVSDGRDGRAVFSYSDEYLARPSPVPLLAWTRLVRYITPRANNPYGQNMRVN